MALTPGSRHDRYRVVSELGQGGMASVYLVRHELLGSAHVLKVLTVVGRGMRERLLLEGQVQARLNHPNVVEVTDVIDVDGALGLVMAFVEGPSLDALLEDKPLPIDVVDQLVPGMLAGVAAAHAAGVVHRDLKPANVLLATSRGRLVPKVADFGIVKELNTEGQPRTQTGMAMGTPHYMAPEQIDSAKDVDARADVWALGVMLYEMVSWKRPFEGETAFHILRQVVGDDYVPLETQMPGLPERVYTAVRLAMSPLDERPSRVEDIYAAWCGDSEADLHSDALSAGTVPSALIDTVSNLTPTRAAPTYETSDVPPSAPADTYVDEPVVDSHETFFEAEPVPAPVEEAISAPSVPVVQGSNRGRLGVMAGGLAVLAGLVCGGMLVGIWSVDPSSYFKPFKPFKPIPTVTDAPVVEQPPFGDLPVVDVEPESEAKPPEPLPPEPVEVPRPLPKPTPVPERPSVPPPAAVGRLLLTSDFPVFFVGPSGRVEAGEVPPGTYRVMMTLDGASPTKGMSVTVSAGTTHQVSCTRELRRCSVR